MNEVSPRMLAQRIASACAGRAPIRIMEVCGTHTVSLYRSGVKSMLPELVHLISGPGCPVCVSTQGYIDSACEIALRENTIICTYGDMLRVPGKHGSLQQQRAAGADVRIVYSALDALEIAAANPEHKIVFLAIGFETTAAGHAAAILEARRRNLSNFLMLCAHKQVVPAMAALLSADDVAIDGFLCPGHVSAIIGAQAYGDIVERFSKPCVVAGFEPQSMLGALLLIVEQVVAGQARIENTYGQVVNDNGNQAARRTIDEVFESASVAWRAMGVIADSGLILRERYRGLDAGVQFDVDLDADDPTPGCRCGEVIQGKLAPKQCGLFATACTPTQPVGPCMVSSEGSCAAAFRYDREPVSRKKESG